MTEMNKATVNLLEADAELRVLIIEGLDALGFDVKAVTIRREEASGIPILPPEIAISARVHGSPRGVDGLQGELSEKALNVLLEAGFNAMLVASRQGDLSIRLGRAARKDVAETPESRGRA
jgi:hypothetical protein